MSLSRHQVGHHVPTRGYVLPSQHQVCSTSQHQVGQRPTPSMFYLADSAWKFRFIGPHCRAVLWDIRLSGAPTSEFSHVRQERKQWRRILRIACVKETKAGWTRIGKMEKNRKKGSVRVLEGGSHIKGTRRRRGMERKREGRTND